LPSCELRASHDASANSSHSLTSPQRFPSPLMSLAIDQRNREWRRRAHETIANRITEYTISAWSKRTLRTTRKQDSSRVRTGKSPQYVAAGHSRLVTGLRLYVLATSLLNTVLVSISFALIIIKIVSAYTVLVAIVKGRHA
jgi:hypothetical protein